MNKCRRERCVGPSGTGVRNGLFHVVMRSSRTFLGHACPPARGRGAGEGRPLFLGIRLAWPSPGLQDTIEDTRLCLSPFFREDLWTFFTFCFTEEDVENFDVTNLSQDMLRSIEADSFWCMSKLLDGIQVSQFCPCGWPGCRGSLQAFEYLLALLHHAESPTQHGSSSFRSVHLHLPR